jgi:hypothetical protein
MKEEKFEGSCVPCEGIHSRDWYAWINLMPPPPDEFHVVGEVYVSNPGVEPFSHQRNLKVSTLRSCFWIFI